MKVVLPGTGFRSPDPRRKENSALVASLLHSRESGIDGGSRSWSFVRHRAAVHGATSPRTWIQSTSASVAWGSASVAATRRRV